jgi:hypothetical protein
MSWGQGPRSEGGKAMREGAALTETLLDEAGALVSKMVVMEPDRSDNFDQLHLPMLTVQY